MKVSGLFVNPENFTLLYFNLGSGEAGDEGIIGLQQMLQRQVSFILGAVEASLPSRLRLYIVNILDKFSRKIRSCVSEVE